MQLDFPMAFGGSTHDWKNVWPLRGMDWGKESKIRSDSSGPIFVLDQSLLSSYVVPYRPRLKRFVVPEAEVGRLLDNARQYGRRTRVTEACISRDEDCSIDVAPGRPTG